MNSPSASTSGASSSAAATVGHVHARRRGFSGGTLPHLLGKICPVLPCKATEEELLVSSDPHVQQLLEDELSNAQHSPPVNGATQPLDATYPDLPSSMPRPLMTSQNKNGNNRGEPAGQPMGADEGQPTQRAKVRFAPEVSIFRHRSDRVRHLRADAKKVAARWKGMRSKEGRAHSRRGRLHSARACSSAANASASDAQVPRRQQRPAFALQLPSFVSRRRSTRADEKERSGNDAPHAKRKTLVSLNIPDETSPEASCLALDPLRLLAVRTQAECDISETTSEGASISPSTPSPRPIDEGMSSSSRAQAEENVQLVPRLLSEVRKENQDLSMTLERLRERQHGSSSSSPRGSCPPVCSSSSTPGGSCLPRGSSSSTPRGSCLPRGSCSSTPRGSCSSTPKGADGISFRRRLSSLLGLGESASSARHPAFAFLGGKAPGRRISTLFSKRNAVCDTTPQVPTVLERRRSFICKFRSSLEERLDRLGKLTKLHWTAKNQSLRGISGKDFERFAAVFQQYDCKRTGALGIDEVLFALDDLGLRLGCSWQQHAELCTRVQHAKDGRIDFGHFCQAALQRRTQIQETQRANLQSIFEQFNRHGSGGMDMCKARAAEWRVVAGELGPEELFDAFTELEMQPMRDDERIAFLDTILECDADCSGKADWEEFEQLVQTMREKLAECRREREMRICSQAKVPTDLASIFRNELTSIHDCFQCFDKFGQCSIERQAMGRFVLQMGFASSMKVINTQLQSDPVLTSILKDDDYVSFVTALKILKHLRDCRLDANFRKCLLEHDMSADGVLKARNVIEMLNCLGLTLHSDQRSKISQVVEELDMDGDGILSRPEFIMVFHRVTEMMQQLKQQEEQIAATRLGFNSNELWDLRESFALLEVEGTGRLSMEGVTKALQFLGESWAAEYEEYYQCLEPQGSQGVLGFEGFLIVCQLVNTLEERIMQNRKEVIWGKVRQLMLNAP